jgi:hypothetical protein
VQDERNPRASGKTKLVSFPEAAIFFGNGYVRPGNEKGRVSDPKEKQLGQVEAMGIGANSQGVVVVCPPLQPGALQMKFLSRERGIRRIMAGQVPPPAEIADKKSHPAPEQEEKRKKEKDMGKFFDLVLPPHFGSHKA